MSINDFHASLFSADQTELESLRCLCNSHEKIDDMPSDSDGWIPWG